MRSLNAHITDPLTSYKAVALHDVKGNMRRVLTCVQTAPGLTKVEYGEMSGLGEWEAARRLSDLKRDGYVYVQGTAKPEGRVAMSRNWPVLSQGALL